jgi:hypothetical protein
MSDQFNKVMQGAMQNQHDRIQKQKDMGIHNRQEAEAYIPTVPAASEEVNCLYCGTSVPAEIPGLHPKIIESCRKFCICPRCRGEIVGSGGVLDRSTHGLERDRRLK